METIGERIKKLRLENKLTLEELAKSIGVSKTSLVKYENGTVKNLKVDIIEKLSKIFNVSADYLTNGNIDNPEDKLIKLLIDRTVNGKLIWEDIENHSIPEFKSELIINDAYSTKITKFKNNYFIFCEILKDEKQKKNEASTTYFWGECTYKIFYGKSLDDLTYIYFTEYYDDYMSFIKDEGNELLRELYFAIYDRNKYLKEIELKSIISDLENL